MYLERRHRATQPGGLHLFELGVTLDKFLCAAAGEADRELAVFVIALDTDNSADSEVGVADLLAQERVALGAAFCRRSSKSAGTGGASRARGGPGRNATHATKKFFGRVRVFGIGFVTTYLSDFGHRAAHGLHQIAGDFGEEARGQRGAEPLLVAKDR